MINLLYLIACSIFLKCSNNYLKEYSYLSHFNSKTAYRNCNLTDYIKGSDQLKQCNLIHVNTVFRHGTRYPSVKNIQSMEKLFDKLKKSESRENLPRAFLNWNINFETNKANELTGVGIEEMMGLGKRFRKLFNAIPNNDKLKKFVKVFSTSISRSKLSGQTFLYSFFNQSKPTSEIDKIIKEDDENLRFFKNCPNYIHSVENNKKMKKEYSKFLIGPEMSSLVDKFNKYLDMKDISLTADDIIVLYLTCGFEIATNSSIYMQSVRCPVKNGLVHCQNNNPFNSKQTSPVCSLFNEKDFAILDYLFDLKHYWTKSYGDPITRLMGCKLMSVIRNQINETIYAHKWISNNSSISDQLFPRAVFWFSHAETILPLVALLGLFNQEIPMTSEAYKNRLNIINKPEYRFNIFRAANIVPFAANLGIHVFYCPNLSQDNKYQIQLKINEKIIPWPQTNGLAHISAVEFDRNLLRCDSSVFNFDNHCKFDVR